MSRIKLFFINQSAMQSVRRFLEKEAVTFELVDITKEWVLHYIMHMLETDKLSENSTNSYLGVLHAVYNRAIVEGVLRKPDVDPFLGVGLVVPPTRKRALCKEELNQLLALDLSADETLARSRDFFLFQFTGCGMCFVDLFYLRWVDISSNGYITYQRSKTKVPLNVKIEPEMQRVIDLYSERGGEYIFPVLHPVIHHVSIDKQRISVCKCKD